MWLCNGCHGNLGIICNLLIGRIVDSNSNHSFFCFSSFCDVEISPLSLSPSLSCSLSLSPFLDGFISPCVWSVHFYI